MAKRVRAWASDDGTLFKTEQEAIDRDKNELTDFLIDRELNEFLKTQDDGENRETYQTDRETTLEVFKRYFDFFREFNNGQKN